MPQTQLRHCVVVADAGRARIYLLRWEEGRGMEKVPRLREADSLQNPERRAADSELFTESRPGLRRGVPGGAGHGVDDHRNQHTAEFERQFASEIVDVVVRHVQRNGSARVLVAASPNMLGQLRPELGRITKAGADVVDLAKDLTKLSPTELQDHLAGEGLLPSRKQA